MLRKKVLLVSILNLMVLSSFQMELNSSDFLKEDDKVSFFTNKAVDRIYVPVAKYPLITWMEIQDGRYPNSKTLKKDVQIGQPISVVVYVQDRSRLYDVIVSDCNAFNIENEKKKSVQIYPGSTDLHKQKMLTWTKEKDENGNIVLFSTFPAFKLPDRKTLTIECNLEICYNACHR
ncbi:uncharacterized protein [Atheta coriaria]|uniref:uncharacterized protein isoform X1 n=2 Tax=Dalotia coriaria TaxID=877792 RepID=UPI0031F3EC3C